MSLDVIRCLPKQRRTFSKESKSYIAGVTDETPDLSRDVVMVDDEGIELPFHASPFWSRADRAEPLLLIEDAVVFFL